MLFSFSSENWKRSSDEVSGLMGLLDYFLKRELIDLFLGWAKEQVTMKGNGAELALSDTVDHLIEMRKGVERLPTLDNQREREREHSDA